MKVLFIGDASNARYTLAKGLRELGHEALVIGTSGGWRRMHVDVCIERGSGKMGAVIYLLRWLLLLPRLRGYDIVDFNGQFMMEFKPNLKHFFYDYIRKHNKYTIATLLGVGHYYVKGCVEAKLFKCSDFNIGDKPRNTTFAVEMKEGWLNQPEVVKLSRHMAETCHLLVGTGYEYWASLHYYFPQKTCFVPLPIDFQKPVANVKETEGPVRFFIGIQKERNEEKGTDILWEVLQKLKNDYPDKVIVNKAENIPYNTYCQMMANNDILIDQLYTCYAMNALIAMSMGLAVATVAIPEAYELLSEKELFPMIDLPCDADRIYKMLERFVLRPEELVEVKKLSVKFVEKHHHYLKVAQRYASLLDRLEKNSTEK
jgi:hypothetical protein